VAGNEIKLKGKFVKEKVRKRNTNRQLFGAEKEK
jgi:hypothetical protein